MNRNTLNEGWQAISGKKPHQGDDGQRPEQPSPPASPDAERLNALRQRITEAEQSSEDRKAARPVTGLPAEAMALVGRIATEIVAGVAVGGFMGWLLDNWLGTSPLFMIVMLFLGAGAGMMNIWRMASGHGLKVGYFDHDAKDKAASDDNDGKAE